MCELLTKRAKRLCVRRRQADSYSYSPSALRWPAVTVPLATLDSKPFQIYSSFQVAKYLYYSSVSPLIISRNLGWVFASSRAARPRGAVSVHPGTWATPVFDPGIRFTTTVSSNHRGLRLKRPKSAVRAIPPMHELARLLESNTPAATTPTLHNGTLGMPGARVVVRY